MPHSHRSLPRHCHAHVVTLAHPCSPTIRPLPFPYPSPNTLPFPVPQALCAAQEELTDQLSAEKKHGQQLEAEGQQLIATTSDSLPAAEQDELSLMNERDELALLHENVTTLNTTVAALVLALARTRTGSHDQRESFCAFVSALIRPNDDGSGIAFHDVRLWYCDTAVPCLVPPAGLIPGPPPVILIF